MPGPVPMCVGAGRSTTTPEQAEATPQMAGSDTRPKVTLACTVCRHRNYITTKNRNNQRERIELRKYCTWCNAHRPHRETR